MWAVFTYLAKTALSIPIREGHFWANVKWHLKFIPAGQ